MHPVTFFIVPGSDKEYVDALVRMKAEGQFAFEKATLGQLTDLPAAKLTEDDGIREVLDQGVRVFQNLSFRTGDGYAVNIQRQQDPGSLFDKVTVNGPDKGEAVRQARLVAAVQKYLNQTSLLNVGNLLGPAATQHFEAREIALARLERTASNLLEEMEQARKRREEEFQARERALDERYQQKQSELDQQAATRQAELDRRSAELEERGKELDDRAAKHARRQHYKEIKEKFRSWGDKFHVTEGTNNLRQTVFWFTVILLLLFGGLAGIFLFHTFTEQDRTLMVVAIVKQVAFTAMFVSTAYFFIRWNNQWFQRHANEEFHLKRMELDIDRASWFVEMAFEWNDEKGEGIPVEIIERLTVGLFSDDRGEHPVEPVDSLAQALMGAARFKVRLGDGTEVEYDRKGIEKLVRKDAGKKKEG